MKYRVLKEYVDPTNRRLHNIGDTVEFLEYHKNESDSQLQYYRVMENEGFIEEIKDEPWKPKEGEHYFAITVFGNVSSFTDGVEWSSEIGNCFQTRDQAEKAVEWLKAFKVLRDDTKGFKPDWSDDRQTKWTVRYNAEHDMLQTSVGVVLVDTILYFATEADAKESIKKHADSWKIFLGVEEEE